MRKFYSFIVLAIICVATSQAQTYDLVVAQDGSGNFRTIREAINAAPAGRTTPFRIFIKNGTYREKDTIPSTKPFIQLIGESVAKTILSWDDYSGKPLPGGGGTYGTSNSATLVINANDFSAVNLTVENTTGDAPQALAVNVNADRASFLNCRFLGGQDTVLVNGDGRRNWFKNCYIDGVVDFIFGGNRAVFDSCIIYAKTRKDNLTGSYITAANTSQTEPYGLVFRNCFLPANRGTTRYVLGRPWQNSTGSTDRYNKTIFITPVYGANIIQPAGWSIWDAGTITSQITYAEYSPYNTNGTPADISGRVAWSKQLTVAEQAVYSDANLFAGWDPCSVFAQPCNVPRDIAVSNFQYAKVGSTTNFTWNISWPMQGIKYELYRTTDNSNYTKINEQVAANDTSINFSYSEPVPPPAAAYKYVLVASMSGMAPHVSDTLLVSSVPTITATGTLGSFLQGLGTPSAVQAYTVSGVNLSDPIVITPPAGFEISADNGTTWRNNTSNVTLTPVSGSVSTTNISVRLNAAAAGAYSGNISHTSVGAVTVNQPVTGTVNEAPLPTSETLIYWPMAGGNADSSVLRSVALDATVPTFSRFQLSDGVTVASIPAFSVQFGQAFAPNANGLWSTAGGGNGGNLNRVFYQQFTMQAKNSHTVRIDSLVLTAAFYNTSSNTRFAVLYSKSGFVLDSAEITGGIGPSGALASSANGQWATPILLANQTSGPTNTYRLALNGSNGVQLGAGETLTIRMYLSCGSTSTGRYAMMKNVHFKGLASQAALPVRLLRFEARRVNSDVVATWAVAEEKDVARYELQRSSNGAGFTTVAVINARNSSLYTDYSETDAHAIAGTSYYRLRAVGKDGEVSFSRIVVITPGITGSFAVMPNPAKDQVYVLFPGELKTGTITLMGTNGQRIAEYPVKSGALQQAISVGGLPKGAYWVLVRSELGVQMLRVMKD